MELFKVIGNDCGGFVTVSRNTLLRRQVDIASILVLTSLDHIPSSLGYNINGQQVWINILETSILVELLDKDEDDSLETLMDDDANSYVNFKPDSLRILNDLG